MLDRIPNLILVGMGAVLGALTRYLLSLTISHDKFPLSTFVSNVVGSFLLGFLVAMHEENKISQDWILLLGVGFMGSLTTMSTFAVDTISSSTVQLSSLNIVLTLSFVLIGASLGKFAAISFIN